MQNQQMNNMGNHQKKNKTKTQLADSFRRTKTWGKGERDDSRQCCLIYKRTEAKLTSGLLEGRSCHWSNVHSSTDLLMWWWGLGTEELLGTYD